MYVGGYFSDALGTTANSIARLNMTDRVNIGVEPLNSKELFLGAGDKNGVDGVVMSIR